MNPETTSSATQARTVSFVRPLTEVRLTDVRFAGGKGANLGELISAGIEVPPGVVTMTG